MTLLKEMNPNLVIFHRILHRYALMSKTLPDNLKEVMDAAVHIVNFIRGRATNHRLFKRLCKEMGTEHTVLLFHTNVRWLSRGKVFNRLFELRYKVLTFLKNCEKKPVYATNLESSRFLLRLAYLADIFSALNDLYISLQGQGTDVISSMEKITAFKWKLTLWLKRVLKCSFDHFPKFNELRESMDVDKNVLSDIENHLASLKSKFDSIFPAEKVPPSWVQNPFLVNVNEVEEKLQEEILDLKASGAAEMMFTASNLTEFWLSQTEAFGNISTIALNPLLHTYANKDSPR